MPGSVVGGSGGGSVTGGSEFGGGPPVTVVAVGRREVLGGRGTVRSDEGRVPGVVALGGGPGSVVGVVVGGASDGRGAGLVEVVVDDGANTNRRVWGTWRGIPAIRVPTATLTARMDASAH